MTPIAMMRKKILATAAALLCVAATAGAQGGFNPYERTVVAGGPNNSETDVSCKGITMRCTTYLSLKYGENKKDTVEAEITAICRYVAYPGEKSQGGPSIVKRITVGIPGDAKKKFKFTVVDGGSCPTLSFIGIPALEGKRMAVRVKAYFNGSKKDAEALRAKYKIHTMSEAEYAALKAKG